MSDYSKAILILTEIHCSVAKGVTDSGNDEIIVNWYNHKMNWIKVNDTFYDLNKKYGALSPAFWMKCYHFCVMNQELFNEDNDM